MLVHTIAPQGLAALEDRVQQDLSWLDLPAREWVIPRITGTDSLQDVIIIGAGMAGMAAAAALKLLGIRSVLFDRAPKGFEGPWATTARMETLRSPKQLTGPALGIPSLTFRAWFEAQFGNLAWEKLDKIPRLQWMDYLKWYRCVLALDVRNEHVVKQVIPHCDGHVSLIIQTTAGLQTVHTRRLIIATGRDGLGGPFVPDMALDLPKHVWAHSSDRIDPTFFEGKRIAVIGAGASAMDSAATALEAGATRVDLLIRRSDMPRINKGKGAGNPGLTHGFHDLSDEWKWRIRHYINTQQVPPPRGSTLRVSRFNHAYFNFSCPVENIQLENNNALSITTPKGIFEVDYVVFSTGFRINWQSRPEYALIGEHARAWKDRYTPHPEAFDQELLDSPDLGPVFELQEKIPGTCPALASIHCFCYPAALSHGTVSGDIPAISDGAKKLAQGIASLFYRENIDQYFEKIRQFDEPELLGDEWIPAKHSINAHTLSSSDSRGHFMTDPHATDTIDSLLALSSEGQTFATRHQREKVVSATQGSENGLFDPTLSGLSMSERLLAALLACRLTPSPTLAAYYQQKLVADQSNANDIEAVIATDLSRISDKRLHAILTFTHTLITDPIRADKHALHALKEAGLSTPEIVTLSQLISFISYQVRLLAGLGAMQSLERQQ